MMPRLRLHFDGWIALPSTVRQRLGIDGDADLELEVEDGALLLRPVGQPVREVEPPPAPARAARPAPEPEKPAAPARSARSAPRESERPAGRKRAPAVTAKLLPTLNARGRRRKAQEA